MYYLKDKIDITHYRLPILMQSLSVQYLRFIQCYTIRLISDNSVGRKYKIGQLKVWHNLKQSFSRSTISFSDFRQIIDNVAFRLDFQSNLTNKKKRKERKSFDLKDKA